MSKKIAFFTVPGSASFKTSQQLSIARDYNQSSWLPNTIATSTSQNLV